MGLIGKLLTAPVRGPVDGVLWIVGTIANHAERELYDEGNIRKELAELEQRFELGEMDEAAFERLEEALLDRLTIARKLKEAAR
jgi:hypothetical protein